MQTNQTIHRLIYEAEAAINQTHREIEVYAAYCPDVPDREPESPPLSTLPELISRLAELTNQRATLIEQAGE